MNKVGIRLGEIKAGINGWGIKVVEIKWGLIKAGTIG